MTTVVEPSTSRASAPTVKRKSRPSAKVSASRGVVQVLLWGYGVITMLPLVLMLVNSFRSTQELYTQPIGLPHSLTFEAYRTAWNIASFDQYFLNSILVTGGAVALSTAVSVPAAYALARWRFRGRSLLEGMFISGLMIPLMVTLLPIFYFFNGLGLIDSKLGLVLLYATNGVPFSIFVLGAFFRQLPTELEEAATVDGAGPFYTFWRVMLPLVRPAIATVVIFRFVPIWNDFLYPLVLLRSTDNYTVPVGLTMFFGEHSTDWATLFAGLVIATVPLVALFIVATRQIVDGLTAGIGK